ncbi:MAG TPA: transcriptional repressor [Spirochaetota bacterium]|nr:transcriptional repressor [Spirochaetota bacterium]HNT09290.1 transcriptional repressor [Spirochaetota bacterium]
MRNPGEVVRRKSRQRERIFEYIQASMDHPSAQQVYDALREEMPALSLGNVYRNIRILIEEGRIVARDFGDGIERFDAITGTHYHFVCERCKRVSDFSMPVQERLTEAAQAVSAHSIRGHTIQFFGVCRDCGKKTRRA